MTNEKYSRYFSGLSGVALPVPKYKYPLEYRKSSRLTYYSTFFNSIEVNSCFYKIPMKATVSRWASSVPDSFKFTFKLFKDITHVKELRFDMGLIEEFVQAISPVGAKKGCILVQFPPGLRNENIVQLETLLHGIRKADPDRQWNIAVEFRHRGWYMDEVYDVLNEYHCTLVIQDIPASATPLTSRLSQIIYVRFHGPTGNYRGSYSDDFLSEYAEYVKGWLDDGKTVYVYFNNTAGDAFNNLNTLNRYIR